MLYRLMPFRKQWACLACGLLLVSQHLYADTIGNLSHKNSTEDTRVKIIEPKKEVELAKSAAIDDERFEFGLYGGYLAVEEFNTNPVFGFSLGYYMTPRFLLQANYGESQVGRASFEENASGSFVSSDGRNFEYYSLLAGYKILRGRSFFGKNSKYNSDIYLFFGPGSVDFIDDKNTGFVIGSSYRVVLTDYLTMNVDFKGYSVEREFLNDKQDTLNTELTLGFNVIF